MIGYIFIYSDFTGFFEPYTSCCIGFKIDNSNVYVCPQWLEVYYLVDSKLVPKMHLARGHQTGHGIEFNPILNGIFKIIQSSLAEYQTSSEHEIVKIVVRPLNTEFLNQFLIIEILWGAPWINHNTQWKLY